MEGGGRMIEFQDVSSSYPDSADGGLKNISLTIPDGQCVLLCGRSGCGKTTLTRLINGLIPQFFAGELSGKVSPPTDFESVTSTNSITPALTLFIISDEWPKFKRNLCFRRKIPDSAGRMAVPSCKERKIGVLCL